MELINERTRKPLARDVTLAETRKERRRGLLGRDHLEADAALMIVPCAAVHTAFMQFPIDLVFIDRDGFAVRIASRVRPWRIAVELRARAVIELPAGRLDNCDLKPGDRLYLAPSRN